MKAHLTAKSRKAPSKPMQELHKRGLLLGRLLDFGCGKGFDRDYYKMEGYDPHYSKEFPKGKFDTITCNYVLNVLANDEEVLAVVKTLRGLLAVGGTCYLSIRRDILKEGKTCKGTIQRNIVLDLPVLKENKSFCIYILK